METVSRFKTILWLSLPYIKVVEVSSSYQPRNGRLANGRNTASIRQSPSGTLRIASPILLGRKQITPLLPRFFERYPKITVEHYLSDSASDLIRDGIDVSIRVGDMQDSSHQARKLGSFRPITGASPAFAERHPELRPPYDLRSVPCLIYLRQPTPFQWAFCGDDGKRIIVEVTGQYRVDVFEALCDAAVAGLGGIESASVRMWRRFAIRTLGEIASGIRCGRHTDLCGHACIFLDPS
jgi:DNA-binding transcriptional LysR family regulator